jgi:hypothetical protein
MKLTTSNQTANRLLSDTLRKMYGQEMATLIPEQRLEARRGVMKALRKHEARAVPVHTALKDLLDKIGGRVK